MFFWILFGIQSVSLILFVPPGDTKHRQNVQQPSPNLAVDVTAGTLFDWVARRCPARSPTLFFILFWSSIRFPPFSLLSVI